VGETRLFMAEAFPSQLPATDFAIPPAEEIGAASPPRYILLRVFRV